MIGKSVIAAAAVIGLMLIPIPYCACPKWDVWIVDDNGQPVPGMRVSVSYMNFSAEGLPHVEQHISDEHGFVTFPRRELSASIVSRCYFMFRWAPHGGYGRHAWVGAFGQGLVGVASTGGIGTDWTGSPEQMQSRIVAKAVGSRPSKDVPYGVQPQIKP
jgi:hypothetical protein